MFLIIYSSLNCLPLVISSSNKDSSVLSGVRSFSFFFLLFLPPLLPFFLLLRFAFFPFFALKINIMLTSKHHTRPVSLSLSLSLTCLCPKLLEELPAPLSSCHPQFFGVLSQLLPLSPPDQ